MYVWTMEPSPSILPGRSIYPSRSIELEIVVKIAGATVLPQFGGSTERGCRSMRAGSPAARSMHRAARPQRQLQCEKQTLCPIHHARLVHSPVRCGRSINCMRKCSPATARQTCLSLQAVGKRRSVTSIVSHINLVVSGTTSSKQGF